MWQVIWRLRLLLWENVLPHLVHLWGRSPVWVTRWICKWLELLVEYGQRLQRCRLTGLLRQRKILFLFLDFRSNEEKRFWYWYNWTPPNKTKKKIFTIACVYNKVILLNLVLVYFLIDYSWYTKSLAKQCKLTPIMNKHDIMFTVVSCSAAYYM